MLVILFKLFFIAATVASTSALTTSRDISVSDVFIILMSHPAFAAALNTRAATPGRLSISAPLTDILQLPELTLIFIFLFSALS